MRARHFSYNPPATQHRQAWARAGHLNMRNNDGSMTAMTVISSVGVVLVFVLIFLLLWYFR